MSDLLDHATTPSSPPATTPDPWWRQAVVYQVYPRSFADSNGDGTGDLPGITARVPHLVSLGVDAVWLSPFYPSALADGGYDVDDHRDVDPAIGTLEQFDEMVATLHAAGIKVVVDIVPNHSSNRHRWFRDALAAGPGSPERERYVFARGRGEHGELPPSDWTAVFGGPAWEPVGDGEWYLHTFAPEQPDWNWDHPEVREDFLTTLRFWADRGVDGFRVDVAHALVKDMSSPLPSAAELAADDLPDGAHRFWDRDEVHEVYRAWRAVFDEYDPPRTAVAEAWVATHRRARYASPEGLGQAFNFDLLRSDFDAASFRRIVEENLRLAAESGTSSTWVLSNHDVVRHVSRYGLPDGMDEADRARWLLSGGTDPAPDLERGARRARAATAFLLALPGSAYLYQGEELGLPEVADLDAAVLQDPTWLRSGHVDKGRDGCRVPLPWTAEGPSHGFGPGPSHLPQPSWFAAHAADVQDRDPRSTLSAYREALAWRRRLRTGEELVFEDAPEGVVRFRRPGGWTCVTNFTTRAVPLPPGRVVLSSGAPADELDGELPGETTVWLLPAD
ncbi:alpha-amylase family glycosyl hydrolase [Kineococcus radiotolerans]|uniref:Alpha amylase catalytic region n=1 Tax=Kineococcus radiotolerans (strain ATCC BAA-149 / DSM 14245 / SRS30216) TaxID=266940 RepID=A6WD75_KINRD|nr:alpha-amylase family glycosyl hydrolase [Kineococcus radiotolerans]ABS04764.1 alpha amylase catalytic region [Kineococcus radiotolerans SRS30216 = ATCC BAA-149]